MFHPVFIYPIFFFIFVAKHEPCTRRFLNQSKPISAQMQIVVAASMKITFFLIDLIDPMQSTQHGSFSKQRIIASLQKS